MRISYDPDKRLKTLDERGLDFEDAPEVFAGLTFEIEDTRQDYGETRMICFGYLAARNGGGRLHGQRSSPSYLQHEKSQ